MSFEKLPLEIKFLIFDHLVIDDSNRSELDQIWPFEVKAYNDHMDRKLQIYKLKNPFIGIKEINFEDDDEVVDP